MLYPLDLFLKNFVAANPAKSMYGFTLNRKKPGHFCLCFLANKNSTVQTWASDDTSALRLIYLLDFSMFELLQKHTISLMQPQPVCQSCVMLSKSGKSESIGVVSPV